MNPRKCINFNLTSISIYRNVKLSKSTLLDLTDKNSTMIDKLKKINSMIIHEWK